MSPWNLMQSERGVEMSSVQGRKREFGSEVLFRCWSYRSLQLLPGRSHKHLFCWVGSEKIRGNGDPRALELSVCVRLAGLHKFKWKKHAVCPPGWPLSLLSSYYSLEGIIFWKRNLNSVHLIPFGRKLRFLSELFHHLEFKSFPSSVNSLNPSCHTKLQKRQILLHGSLQAPFCPVVTAPCLGFLDWKNFSSFLHSWSLRLQCNLLQFVSDFQ